jgi:glycerophosphoryl diester phosphodiesterase
MSAPLCLGANARTEGSALPHIPTLACDDMRVKLVAHRGWHRLSKDDSSRPLENTRQAYLYCAALGVPFAECDVYATKDGELVLSHDMTFQSMAANPTDARAQMDLESLSWDEVEDLELSDGSRPVLLRTVLEDLQGSGTRLVVETKTSAAAAALGRFLLLRPELTSAVAWIMSFSLKALEAFAEGYGPEPVESKQTIRTAWLLDNPRIAYDASEVHEGETSFDYSRESVATFLARLSILDRVQRLGCGLYVQYNPSLTPNRLQHMRHELELVKQSPSTFLGLWSDASLDLDFDQPGRMSEFLPFVDAINTDFAPAEWVA